MKSIVIVSVSILLLTACARQPEYTQATSLPALTTPDTVSNQKLGQLYVVPPQSGVVSKKDAVPFPPTVGAQDDANIASLQSLGSQSWVFNAKSPATTWAQLLSFVQQRGISVANRDLQQATLQTGWFAQGLQPGFEVRYQFRLEQGLQPNTTEIYLTNEKRAMAETSVLSSPAIDTVDDKFHVNWLAEQLITVLNDADNLVGDSYLATTINLPQKVMFTTDNDEPVLVTIVSDERLQQALTKALTNSPFTLYASDLARGVWHFNRGVEQKRSFLIRLINGGKLPDANSQHTLADILTHLPTTPEVNQLFPDVQNRTGKKLSGVRGYLLVLRKQSERTVIYLRDGYGKPLKGDKSRELLDSIRLRLF